MISYIVSYIVSRLIREQDAGNGRRMEAFVAFLISGRLSPHYDEETEASVVPRSHGSFCRLSH